MAKFYFHIIIFACLFSIIIIGSDNTYAQKKGKKAINKTTTHVTEVAKPFISLDAAEAQKIKDMKIRSKLMKNSSRTLEHYKYDFDGYLWQLTQYQLRDSLVYRYSYKFDDSGKLIKKIEDSPYRDKDDTTYYYYDSSNNILCEKTSTLYDKVWKKVDSTAYRYSEGKIHSIISYKVSYTKIGGSERWIREFEETGNRTVDEDYNLIVDGKADDWYRLYTIANKRPVSCIVETPAYRGIESYYYDSQGLMTKQSWELTKSYTNPSAAPSSNMVSYSYQLYNR